MLLTKRASSHIGRVDKLHARVDKLHARVDKIHARVDKPFEGDVVVGWQRLFSGLLRTYANAFSACPSNTLFIMGSVVVNL